MRPLRQRNGSRAIVSPPRETGGGFFMSKRKSGDETAELPSPPKEFSRRSIFISAAASLICAPTVVRVASLIPIQGVIVANNASSRKTPIHLGFAGALALFWMEKALKHGWDEVRDGSTFGGISESQARNYVAYVRSQGTFPPHGARVSNHTKAEFSRSNASGRASSLGDLNRAMRRIQEF